MNILSRLWGRRESSSREIAKERLRLVLAYDRIKISPRLLQTLKDEIIAAISKHVEIDREGVEITFVRERRCNRLVADIPLLNTRRKM